MLIKSEFGRNVGKMMGGMGLAQVINFAASLVLARLYTEADFGLFALFTSTMMLLTNVAGLRYELATVLAPSQQKAYSVLGLALGLNICFGLGSLLLLLLFGPSLLRLLGSEELGWVVLLVPIGIFLQSAFNSWNYCLHSLFTQ